MFLISIANIVIMHSAMFKMQTLHLNPNVGMVISLQGYNADILCHSSESANLYMSFVFTPL